MSAADVGTPVGTVVELWRYPVKSLGGERVDVLGCTARGLNGDRAWAVQGRDGKLGSGKTFGPYRRMPGLLSLASGGGDGEPPWIEFEDGERVAADHPRAAQRLAAIVGEPVTVVHETTGPFVDDSPLHLLTTASLDWLKRLRPDDVIETGRIRPNVVVAVDGEGDRPEDAWCGRAGDAGSVRLSFEKPVKRCVMVTMAQPGLEFAPRILKDLEHAADGYLGVYCKIVGKGEIRVGDRVTLH